MGFGNDNDIIHQTRMLCHSARGLQERSGKMRRKKLA
jgi:hypothetical protein